MNASDRLSRWLAIKERNTWREATILACKRNEPPEPLQRARVWFTRYSTIEPDFTNLVQGFKHIEDGLVEAGIIVDDKPSIIGQPSCTWEKASPKHGKVRVRVESVDE
jgi:hypothetical protein